MGLNTDFFCPSLQVEVIWIIDIADVGINKAGPRTITDEAEGSARWNSACVGQFGFVDVVTRCTSDSGPRDGIGPANRTKVLE